MLLITYYVIYTKSPLLDSSHSGLVIDTVSGTLEGM